MQCLGGTGCSMGRKAANVQEDETVKRMRYVVNRLLGTFKEIQHLKKKREQKQQISVFRKLFGTVITM